MLKQLWNDEAGALISIEWVLAATILAIGMITGLHAVQVAVVTELSDTGAAVAAVNQTYNWGAILGHHALTEGSNFQDLEDDCDDGCTQAGPNSRCVTVCAGSLKEQPQSN